MSLTAKIMAVLSVIWVGLWMHGCWPFKNPGDYIIFLIVNMPVILGWLIRAGFYLCRNRKNFPAGEIFKNPGKLTSWVTGMIAVEIFMLGLAWVLQGNNLSRMHAASHPAVTLLILFLCLLLIAFPLLILMMKLIWIYRAGSNTHQLGVEKLAFSPRSAVGWSIVPFGIYYTMKEICKSNWSPSSQWKEQSSPVLFKLWWAVVWINIVLLVLFAVLPKWTASAGSVIFYFLIILHEILFVILINKLSKKQIFAHNNQQANNISPVVS